MRSASSSTCSRRTTCSPNRSPGSCTTSPSMPSPGKADVSEPRQAADFLREARERERAACLPEAIAPYEGALDAYRDCGDDHGCALAYHNLGMVSADRGWLNAADCYFRESRALAERVGD